jgi:predicted GNAT family acetyltransferase
VDRGGVVGSELHDHISLAPDAGAVKRWRHVMEGLTITRHDADGRGEYRAHVAGSDHIGRLTWFERNGAKVADHTLVPPALGGRGVAAELVKAMIADARAEGFKIDPACSYVAVAFRRHPEWADLHA